MNQFLEFALVPDGENMPDTPELAEWQPRKTLCLRLRRHRDRYHATRSEDDAEDAAVWSFLRAADLLIRGSYAERFQAHSFSTRYGYLNVERSNIYRDFDASRRQWVYYLTIPVTTPSEMEEAAWLTALTPELQVLLHEHIARAGWEPVPIPIDPAVMLRLDLPWDIGREGRQVWVHHCGGCTKAVGGDAEPDQMPQV